MKNSKLRFGGVLGCLGFILAGQISLAKADPLDDIATPISNPVNFEDPRIESNIRPIAIYHKLDNKFITQGGNVKIFALQARYAVTDRLALIATKDGYVHLQPDAVLNDESGLANVGGGLKYAFYKDESSIFSGGLRYEAPIGAKRVLQGQGSGSFNPFVSGAVALGSERTPLNLVAGTGFRLAVEESDSSFYDADLHLDTKLGWFSPIAEVNYVHVIDAGDRLPIADEGQDFFNFGAANADGKSMLTGAIGGRVALDKDTSWGTAYQFPLDRSSGSYVTDWRVTTDLIFSF